MSSQAFTSCFCSSNHSLRLYIIYRVSPPTSPVAKLLSCSFSCKLLPSAAEPGVIGAGVAPYRCCWSTRWRTWRRRSETSSTPPRTLLASQWTTRRCRPSRTPPRLVAPPTRPPRYSPPPPPPTWRGRSPTLPPPMTSTPLCAWLASVTVVTSACSRSDTRWHVLDDLAVLDGVTCGRVKLRCRASLNCFAAAATGITQASSCCCLSYSCNA